MKDEHGNEWIETASGGLVGMNLGTFGIDGATEENAIANMEAFIKDCAFAYDLSFERLPSDDYGQGRYAFLVKRDNYFQTFEIQMPGRELKRVRFMGGEQNILEFPRLYVDGSSWVWMYAILKDESWMRTCPKCQSWGHAEYQLPGQWWCYVCEAEFYTDK